jgi:hypothetical protein
MTTEEVGREQPGEALHRQGSIGSRDTRASLSRVYERVRQDAVDARIGLPRGAGAEGSPDCRYAQA